MKTLLTIGGYDPSNGAGITKDLEIFSVQGHRGISVPTSLVVQGPGGACDAASVPIRLFRQMLDRARKDFVLGGVKIGALADRAYAEAAAEFLVACPGVPVVLDPVASAKNGLKLVTDEGFERMVKEVFPLTTCVTPNLEEAQLLLGDEVGDGDAMEHAARSLAAMGPTSVVIKGGHLPGDPIDLLFDGRNVVTYGRKRVARTVHGTGCLFSSCLLAFLADDYPVKEAFLETERAMERFIERSIQPSEGGYFYAFPGIDVSRNSQRRAVLDAMADAASRLKEMNLTELIPSTGMSMGYALPGALVAGDVAAFPEGISLRRGRVHIKGTPGFGLSERAASLCLACMKHYPFLRSAAEIEYDRRCVEKARHHGLSVICYDRVGSSLEKGSFVESALQRTDGPPDLIYDGGCGAREPKISLFAHDPQELIKKMEMIKPCTTN